MLLLDLCSRAVTLQPLVEYVYSYTFLMFMTSECNRILKVQRYFEFTFINKEAKESILVLEISDFVCSYTHPK